jgi:uncharacterized membrane protein YvlD (DUF360 family)
MSKSKRNLLYSKNLLSFGIVFLILGGLFWYIGSSINSEWVNFFKLAGFWGAVFGAILIILSVLWILSNKNNQE